MKLQATASFIRGKSLPDMGPVTQTRWKHIRRVEDCVGDTG